MRVNNSPGQSQSEYDSYSAVKGATALGFEDSKISWASAGAQGVTPGGQPVTGSNFYVTFEAWIEVVQGDYISADSFLNDYEQIELTPDGVTSLRDYIDFRRNTSSLPVPNDAPRFDYEYYLSRIDKIAIQVGRLLHQNSGLSGVKTCSASRPDRAFKHFFALCTALHLFA